jgi:acyl-coenzyme A thioesterase PaaI-like protein
MDKQPNSSMCFVCGIDNPIGLHLRFYTDDKGRCLAQFRPGAEHQGYPGHLHGGTISTLLRFAMGPVCHTQSSTIHGLILLSSTHVRWASAKPARPPNQSRTVARCMREGLVDRMAR